MVQLWETQRKSWKDGVAGSASHLDPVIPVVFYTGKRQWKTPPSLHSLMKLPEELSGFVPRFEVLFLSLQDLGIDKLTGSPVAHVLAALLAADDSLERLAEVFRAAIESINPL